MNEQDPEPRLRDFIMESILTDSRNRLSLPSSSSPSRSFAAPRFARCVVEGNQSLLRSCASRDNNYSRSHASQLNDVFKRIAKSLATLRIAK